jgi:uncharacterized membrane protein
MTVSTAAVAQPAEPPSPGREPAPIVAPSLDDPVANLAVDGLGGVLGRRARLPRSRGAIAFLLLLMTLVTTAVGIGMRDPCFDTAWTGGGNQQYTHMCYSDIPFLYQGRGFSDRQVAYVSTDPNYYLEYPVLTGAAMQTAALLADKLDVSANDQGRWFYVFTTWFLLAFAGITVLALIGFSGPRPWDAALFALSPGLMLTGTINWDLIAVGLASVALLAWARRKPVLAGVFIGLGTAAKLYPALLLVALFLLCWRAGRMKHWGLCLTGAVVAWLVVNLPFMLQNWQGWAYFYTFNENRAPDWGSFWLFLEYSPLHANITANRLNLYFVLALIVSFAAIGLLTWLAPRRPRLAQVAFLTAAAFILFNKVYSPQYVLWLIPLAALARPRWRDFLVWQACEILYYVAIWFYLVTLTAPTRGLPQGGYDAAIAIHIGGTIFFAVQVIRDMLNPQRDPIRAGGYDDTGGGVLDRAPDIYGFGAFAEGDPAVAFVYPGRPGESVPASPEAVPVGVPAAGGGGADEIGGSSEAGSSGPGPGPDAALPPAPPAPPVPSAPPES